MKLTILHQITDNPLSDKFMMHAHETYEILYMLSGDADYYVEGTRYTLRCGDIMLMRKSEFHHLILKSNKRYERIIVNFDLPFIDAFDSEHHLLSMFDERPLGKYNHYSTALFPENHWGYYLNKLVDCKQESIRVVHLLSLLGELAENFKSDSFKNSGERGELVSAIVRFINENLAEQLSLDMLCERFYLSKTHLNRLFKQATGSTVWNYIVMKRLLRAHELLRAGENPTSVYLQCGFRDYTTFFRAYKKQFQVSPKQNLGQ